MKVFNLTDVPTRVLKKQCMVNVPFTVGGVTIKPGQSGEVKARYRSQLQRFLLMGAASIGVPPEGYVAAPIAEADTDPAPPSPSSIVTEIPPPEVVPSPTEIYPEEPPPDTQSSPGDEESSTEDKPRGRRGRRKKKS